MAWKCASAASSQANHSSMEAGERAQICSSRVATYAHKRGPEDSRTPPPPHLIPKLKTRGNPSGCTMEEELGHGFKSGEIGMGGVVDTIEAREWTASSFYRPPWAPLRRWLGRRLMAGNQTALLPVRNVVAVCSHTSC